VDGKLVVMKIKEKEKSGKKVLWAFVALAELQKPDCEE